MNNQLKDLLNIINVEDIESFSLTIKESFVYEEELCELGFYPKGVACNRGGKLHRIIWERKNENNFD
jgi:hypothetical protein